MTALWQGRELIKPSGKPSVRVCFAPESDTSLRAAKCREEPLSALAPVRRRMAFEFCLGMQQNALRNPDRLSALVRDKDTRTASRCGRREHSGSNDRARVVRIFRPGRCY